VHLDASCEQNEVIAQANARVDAGNRLLDDSLTARGRGDVFMSERNEVTLMDISPGQMVSISAALIPFLEHDDANRALMGSNMQRQAVPLLRSERSLVGTGMEGGVARDSGACRLAEGHGVVRYAGAGRASGSHEDPIHPNLGGVRAYDLL
jgi:DNA-directed RNA polymerase subunit beta